MSQEVADVQTLGISTISEGVDIAPAAGRGFIRDSGEVGCFVAPDPRDYRDNPSPANNEMKDEQDEGNDEQEVNQTAGHAKYKSTTPKDQEKNGND